MPALITSGTAYTAADLVEAYRRADDLARGLEFCVLRGDVESDHARISTAIDTVAHAARTHVRRSIGQQFRRAREQLGIAALTPPPHQEEP